MSRSTKKLVSDAIKGFVMHTDCFDTLFAIAGREQPRTRRVLADVVANGKRFDLVWTGEDKAREDESHGEDSKNPLAGIWCVSSATITPEERKSKAPIGSYRRWTVATFDKIDRADKVRVELLRRFEANNSFTASASEKDAILSTPEAKALYPLLVRAFSDSPHRNGYFGTFAQYSAKQSARGENREKRAAREDSIRADERKRIVSGNLADVLASAGLSASAIKLIQRATEEREQEQVICNPDRESTPDRGCFFALWLVYARLSADWRLADTYLCGG